MPLKASKTKFKKAMDCEELSAALTNAHITSLFKIGNLK